LSPDNINARFEYTEEGRRKTRMVTNVPRAHGRQLADWGGQVVRYAKLMVSGHGVIKTQSGFLRRNIGMKMDSRTDYYNLTVGTGVGSLKEVKYASVLDQGATIRAKNRTYFYRHGKKYQFKNGPYLYIPIYGGGMRHKGEPKSFRLKKSVRIPPFGWFTRRTIKKMRPLLDRMMSKAEVLKKARSM